MEEVQLVDRKYIEVSPGHPAEFEVGGEVFTSANCRPFAQIENLAAGIIEAVLQTADGRFLRVTTVSTPTEASDPATRSGWYVADIISLVDASLLRESWAVLGDQPLADHVIP